ncbi:EAL domain-containing protein [Couchioplanes caeruleus]|uniref:Signaling protein n=2 Tax=Couchioplanes caeruleus TaxID=56438 RepID=A0A1K0GIY6_9ACTN|nr:EAL domain-containing protein [Couchioplanes caeruleus]OJF12222.1 signaling protein [Couchioplanes caeruleus subsp. caeruleus]ROP32083.1 EAL domain-containing protein (putative c-di-GMP-specific phosphodiesterase class I) [Couchioplanes caeruleus]
MTVAQLPSPANRAVREVLYRSAVETAFQPIVQLEDGMVNGYEALARFDRRHFANPAEAFAAADAAGLGVELEILAIERSLLRLGDVPDGVWLSLNASVEALLTPRTITMLLAHAHRRIAVELTEHTQVTDYTALREVMDLLRAAGILIAVDDAGAGFANLSQILQIQPDVIKLDISLTRGIDQDPVRIALARALVTFAESIGAMLVAEGIETYAEHAQLLELGVRHGQGYYIAKPGPLPRRHIEPLL